MQPNQLIDQREADAGAFKGAAALALNAMKPVEDMRQLGLRNADARIAHGQHRRPDPQSSAYPR